MKKRIALLLTLALSVGTLAACGNTTASSDAQQSASNAEANATEADSSEEQGEKSEGELTKLRWGVMTGAIDYFTATVGKEQGIYEKYGLDIEVTEYAYGINTIDAVVNGTADVGNLADFAAANRFGNTQGQTDLVIFSELSGGHAQNGGLYVAPEFVDNLDALDGSKGFITNPGTALEYQNSVIIEHLGFDEANQNFVNTDSNQTSLAIVQNNEASAAFVSGANAQYYEKFGWSLAIPSSELNITTYGYLLTTRGYLAENTEAIAKLLQATDETAKYITEHEDEVAAFLEAKTGLNPDDFKLTWESIINRIGLTEEGVNQLESIEKWAFTHNKFDTDYDVRDYIDSSAIKLAFPDRVDIQE